METYQIKDHIRNFTEFEYWFRPTTDTLNGGWNKWDIFDSNYDKIGWLTEEADGTVTIRSCRVALSDEIQDKEDDIRAEFDNFKLTRPEYAVIGAFAYPESCSDEEVYLSKVAEYYDKCLVGCYLTTTNLDSKFRNGNRELMAIKMSQNALDWLHTTNFYTSPASTRFHEAYIGGLLQHTCNVAQEIRNMMYLPKFNTADIEISEAVMVALMHDWCKIGMYERYMKWTKDDNNQWIQEPAFKRVDSPMPLGHGESSMFIAQKLFRLSTPMAAAIRWHMGAWRVLPDDYDHLQYSNENYPLVHMLQFADQLSIVKY